MISAKTVFLIILTVFVSCFYSCKDNSTSNSSYTEEERIAAGLEEEIGYKTDTYCAEIQYYNPNTGTSSTYTLNVEIEDNELVKIIWPNGGWLDDSHFTPQELDEDGYCSFTSDRGNRYKVQITGEECSYTDSSRVRSDFQEEEDAVTCPQCGSQKESYNTICYSCERKKKDIEEHTCKKCGNYDSFMFSMDDYCSDCERKIRDEENY